MLFLFQQLLSCFIDNHDISNLASLNFALCSDLLDSNFYCFSCDVSNAICRIQFFVKGDWFPLDHFVLFQDFEHEIRITTRNLIHLDLFWNKFPLNYFDISQGDYVQMHMSYDQHFLSDTCIWIYSKISWKASKWFRGYLMCAILMEFQNL